MFYVLLCLFVVGGAGRFFQATPVPVAFDHFHVQLTLQSLGQTDERLVRFLEGDLQYAVRHIHLKTVGFRSCPAFLISFAAIDLKALLFLSV
jgi:hypothetical protein